MKNSLDLTQASIPKLIRQLAIPTSIGFFFNTMYNVVDTFFGGLISTQAIAALSLSFPVFFIVIALGSGISTGVTALISNSLGEKKEKDARNYAVQSISFSIIIGILLTILGFLFSPFLFKLLGAEGEYLTIAVSYINIILLGSVFFILTFVINGILSAQGDTKTYRNFLVAGFFLNLLLDPAFIYGWFGLPALGLTGVAWATFSIQAIGLIYMGYRVSLTKIFCRECLQYIKPKYQYYKNISAQSFPAGLNMLTVAIGIFVITYFISIFGKSAVAAYGIATRIDQIALLPNIGLNMAVLALIGQNNGAKKFDRCGEAYRTAMKYGFFLTTLGALAVFIFAGPLMSVFSKDQNVINIGVQYLHISILIYWAYTINFLTVSALQGLKKPNYAIWIGAYRQIAAPLVIFYLLSRLLNFGLTGIWWGIFIINWSAAVFSLFYVKRTLNKMFN